MDPYYFPFNLRQGLICLSVLVGIGVGIMAISRQHRTPGALAVAGFLFLGVDPIAEILIYQVVMANYTGENYEVFNWAYACAGGISMLLGLGCLVASIFTLIRKNTAEEIQSPSDKMIPDLKE